MYETYSRDIAEQINDLASEMLDAYEKKALSAGVERVQTIIEYGSPKQVIARDIPKSKKIDLIICGVTGKGEVERFFLGSVSESIVRSAKCDVLVVRNII
jgi:nucleotide-binding universal stress UspA family protein